MQIPEENNDVFIQKVLSAFDGVPYPKGVIAPHECEECWELENTFENKNWKTIDDKIVEENFSNLSLFSSEAFNYFLPAYLTYSLKNFNDNFVCEFTIYALTPNNNGLDYWNYRFEKFTDEQMNVIYDFLSLVLEKSDDNFDFFHEQVKLGMSNLKELSKWKKNLKELSK